MSDRPEAADDPGSATPTPRGLRARLRPELATLTPYRAPERPPAVKLDANESPWPLPEDARARIGEVLGELPYHRYPDGRASALRERLAETERAHPDELVLGVGSDEVIALLLSAFRVAPFGRRSPAVVFPSPTFVMYAISARMQGVTPVPVPLSPASGFALDPDALVTAARSADASIVFLATPNNPTGQPFPDEGILRIADALPDALVIVDEAYAAFARRQPPPGRGLFGRRPNLGLLGTLSKRGLAGARVGWARLPRDIARAVDGVRQPFDLNAPAQALGLLALGELAPVLDEQVRRIVAERDRLTAELRGMGGVVDDVLPSEANFLFLRVPDAPALVRRCADAGVGIRHFPQDPAVAARYVRVTVGTPEENDALLQAVGSMPRGSSGP